MPRKERDRVLTDLVAQYAARLEYYCRRAPLQWFNFYQFWNLPAMVDRGAESRNQDLTGQDTKSTEA